MKRTLQFAVLAWVTIVAPRLGVAQTAVPSGTLAASQTWTAAGSPYVLQGDLTIPIGVTLTLSAGAIVEFGPGDDQAANQDPTRTELRVAGTLNVNGLSGSPVLLRSGATAPTTGGFWGIDVLAGGALSGAYLQVQYAETAVRSAASGVSLSQVALHDCVRGIEVVAGSLNLAGGEILRSTRYGLMATGGSLTASDLRVEGSALQGLYARGGNAQLDHCLIIGGGDNAVYAGSGALATAVVLDHVTIYGNAGIGVVTGGSSLLQFTLQNSLVVANGSGVYRGGTSVMTAANLVWGNSGYQYSGVTPSLDSLLENPLVVDLAGGDLRPTSNSGLRFAATDGLDIGALPYGGVATIGLVGHFHADTVLSAATSPHLVLGDLTVEPGVTLTIEAGAELRFAAATDRMQGGINPAVSELSIDGRLLINGTVNAPVLLTASTPIRGAWYGIHQRASAAGTSVRHTVIEYARFGIDSDTNQVTSVADTTVRESATSGLDFAGPATLDRLVVRDNGNLGVVIAANGSVLRNSLVFDNAGIGVDVSNNGSGSGPVVQHNTIIGNGHGLHIAGSSSPLVTTQDNVVVSNAGYGLNRDRGGLSSGYNLVWGNGTNYRNVLSPSDLSENPLFVDEPSKDFRVGSRSPARLHGTASSDIGALPFDGTPTPQLVGHLYANTHLAAAGSPYFVPGDLTVEAGVVLSFDPGVEVRFAAGADLMDGGIDSNLAELRVLGNLIAVGTSALGQTFTSAAATPAPGDWYGIHLVGGASTQIDYATIEYARDAVRSSAATGAVVRRSTLRRSSSHGLYVDGGAANYDQLVIRDGVDLGVEIVGASGTLQRSQIFANGGHGILVGSGTLPQTFNILHNTIVSNGGWGVRGLGSNSQTVVLRDNIVALNASQSAFSSGGLVVQPSYNLVWGNPVNSGGGAPFQANGRVSENPLFVDAANNDYRITARSIARGRASDGTDIGALPFDGAPTTIPGQFGRLSIDTTWTLSDSPVLLTGDLTIEPGVALTIEAGVEVRVAEFDVLGSYGMGGLGGIDLVVGGRLIVAGTPSSRVWFHGDVANPLAGAWVGIQFLPTAGPSSIRGARIRHVLYGLVSHAPAGLTVRDLEIDKVALDGITITAGTSTFDNVYVHGRTEFGLYITGGSSTFTNLVLADVGLLGIYVNGDASTALTLNHATINGVDYGIIVGSSHAGTFELRNSSITNCQGVAVSSPSSPNVTLETNNLWGNTTDLNGIARPATTIAGPPMYTNPAAGDFTPRPGSVLIDAADPATSAAVDLRGIARPHDGDGDGTAVADIGAFEFDPSANQPPIASAGPDQIVTSGQVTTLDGSASTDADGTIVDYSWSFGDGTTGSGAIVTHTFTGGADHTVLLVVTDDDGAVDSDTVFVEVNLPPLAEAGAPRTGAPGQVIGFSGAQSTDSDGTVATFAWDFGDGTTATGISASHAYAGAGTFTVTLAVTDDDGAAASDTTTVEIIPPDTSPPSIVHTPIADGQAYGQAVIVSADITDPSGVTQATLYYRSGAVTPFSIAPMSATTGPTYVATLPASALQGASVQYYIEASDGTSPANVGTLPSAAPGTTFSFLVAAPSPPIITHTPIGDGQPEAHAVQITANATAQSGLTSVSVYFRAPGGAFSQVPLTNTSSTTYLAEIPVAAVHPPLVEYYLEAVDTVGQSTTHPLGGAVHAFLVTAADTAPPGVSHVPVSDGQPENQAVRITADVSDPSGVTQVDLHYRLAGSSAFTSVTMLGSGGTYSATIAAADVQRPALEYYLTAIDGASVPNAGTEPPGAPSNLHAFTVLRTFDVGAGDLVISELMVDPSGVEAEREWFEVHNPTGRNLDLDGLTFSDAGADGFTVAAGAPLVVPSGGYLVFARSDDTALNGGVVADYVYAGLTFANASDALIVAAGSLEVDRVEYDGGATFPRTPGRALSLDPLTLDALSNDGGGSWCEATSPLTGGDFGTPGQPNDSCADVTAPTIVHTPVTNGQPSGQPVTVTAIVTDDRALGAVELAYRAGSAGGFTTVVMTNVGTDVYEAGIDASAVTATGVHYYLRAEDAASTPNAALSPATAPAIPYAFDVTPDDTAGPTIQHVPLVGPRPPGTALDVQATIADPSGVQQADLHFRGPADAWQTMPLVLTTADTYAAQIPATAVRVPGVQYYLSAQDTRTNPASLPAGGEAAPFLVVVEAPDEIPPAIVHTPVSDGQPRGEAVIVSAQVTDASGLSEARLYFRTSTAGPFLSVPMADDGADTFAAEIPGALLVVAEASYYIEAVDGSDQANVARDPARAPDEAHRFTVAAPADADGPEIVHQSPSGDLVAGAPVTFEAEVRDASGVGSVQLHLRRIGNDALEVLPMSPGGGDRWRVEAPGRMMRAPGVEYYVEAVDAAAAENRATWPSGAPSDLLSLTVTATSGPVRPEEDGCSCASKAPHGEGAWSAVLLLLALFTRRRRQRTGTRHHTSG